jgi:UPF0755 protein
VAHKILALDIGDKRIGVAIADKDAPFPQPLVTLEASANLADSLNEVIKKNNATEIVVGLPRNQSGERTAQTDRVEKVVTLLKLPKDVKVYWQDESLTSVKAEAELKSRKKPFKKANVDSLAATYILEDFLQSPNPVNPAATANSKPQKKRSLKRILLLLGGSFLVFILISLLSAYAWYRQQLKPLTRDDVYHVVTVESGSSTAEIASQLANKKIIRNARAFQFYVSRHNPLLQAGSYRLSSKLSVPDIAQTLASGKVTSVDVLIPPGIRLDQVEDRLKKAGFSEPEIQQAFEAAKKHPFLEGLSDTATLEGYLFPETYKVGPESTATQLVNLMLDTFQKRITPEIQNGIKAQGLNVHQAIILASIVQKEVSDKETQRTVAQVFLTRYKQGMALGSDVTFIYAAAITGQPATPALDSPYNTRKYAGLPPGPISNFNLAALEAVANPSSTDYLYFVAGDDGKTYFSHSEAEHEALTRQHCIKLCE